MGTALTCLGLFVVLVAAHYMINMGHLMMVRQELQSAVDAAALAGASSLNDTPDAVESAAISVASENYADGVPVSTQSPGIQIKATAVAGDHIIPGCVKVAATREIQFFGGPFCGLPDSANITTVAMAGTAGSVTTVNQDQLFPLAVSIDVIPVDHTLARSPLTMRHLGDQITLFTDAQHTRNVAFTTFDHSSMDVSYLRQSINQALKPDPEAHGLIPQLSVGDSINLNNSASGTRFLAEGDHARLLTQHALLTLPVIMGNPQDQDKGTVIGFATFRVVGVVLSRSGQAIESMSVCLVKGMVHGSSKPLPAIHGAEVDRALAELSAGVPKLVSLDYMETKPWLQRPDLPVGEPAQVYSRAASPESSQSASTAADSDAQVETCQAPTSKAAASTSISERPSDDWQEYSLGPIDVKAKPWIVDISLSLLIALPFVLAMIHAFTRQPAYAKSYKKQSQAANPASPYVRRWKKSGRVFAGRF